MGGVQKTSDFLDRSTWILATLLLVLILLSNISLTSDNTPADSRLIQDNAVEEVIPEAIPEVIPEIPVATPEQ